MNNKKIIADGIRNGLTTSEMAIKTGLNVATIRRLRREYEAGGDGNIEMQRLICRGLPPRRKDES